ncbi:MAG: hypothetical protein HDR11_06725 [Lachnospiraceae bacterium]|nr:hypothetical protein [Lachnospiraceae bacterium]
MGKLNTDFKDDILSEKMNGKRRVKLIPQEDGTYIIEDVTEYTQIGSSYGQKEINLLNSTVNGKLDSEKVIDDLGTALAVTEEGVPVGCKAISALNSNLADSLGGLTFGVDSDGNPGYKKAGADTVTPFKSRLEFTWLAGRLAGYINLPNTGHITLETLTQNISGNIGIYGAHSPTVLTHTQDIEYIASYTTTSVGHTDTIDTGTEYPYIVLYCVYIANAWEAAVKIST